MNKRKLFFVSSIANIFEWYDYALFGHFAQIIGEKFFPESNENLILIQAFSVFAIGYLMRPIGGVFFGIIGDKFGRRSALSFAIICMAFPTALIGTLPTYKDIGIIATILMVIIRMLQGLSMGGALTGSVSFIIEHTDKKHRGVVGSIPMSSICIGFLLASSVTDVIKYSLSEEEFYDFGWRIPFIIGILILFAGLYIKKYTTETPLFKQIKQSGEIIQSPLKTVAREHWFDMIISILINSTGSVIFYLSTVYLISFLRLNRDFASQAIDNLVTICYVTMAVFTVIAGWISDKIGRKKIFLINLVLIILSATILIEHVEKGNLYTVFVAQIILSILAASYIGPEPALQAEFYPTNIRNTALSISYNIATAVFGGTTPLIFEYIRQNTGSVSNSVYYLIICAFFSIVALFFYQDRSINKDAK